jgi:hypothetical protein
MYCTIQNWLNDSKFLTLEMNYHIIKDPHRYPLNITIIGCNLTLCDPRLYTHNGRYIKDKVERRRAGLC